MPDNGDGVLFSKHTDLNRCVIDSPNGPLTLTLPIQHFVGKSYPMDQLLISEHGDWRHKHWHALQSSYSSSPFFEFYQDDFIPIFFGQQIYFVDFINQINSLIVDLLQLRQLPVDFFLTKDDTKNISQQVDETVLCFQAANNVGSNCTPPHVISSAPLDPYYQVFTYKHGFTPHLSIVDLLFNMGPESSLILCRRI